MKVLMPATHYYPVIGGIETWTKNIAEKLAEKVEVFIITGRVKYQPEKQELNGVRIWRTSLFALSNLSASPLFYTISLLPFVFLKSLFLIKKEKINILHCQGFLSGLMGFLLSKITGIPYIVTVQRMERRGNWLKEFIYNKAAVCIGVSHVVGAYFRKIGCRNVEVIPNGIDLKRFEGLERKQHEGFMIMTVARLEKVKGVRYLIEALRYVDGSPTAIIIGDGSERRNLENLVKELDLEDKVKFLGQIPNEKIPEYLAMADCFVLPSLKEGFGIAVLEAMAAGVPVVASKVGGILDIIEDGKTGLLAEPGNPQEIAKAIREVYSGWKSAKTDLEKYDWQNITQRVFKIYEDNISNANLSA